MKVSFDTDRARAMEDTKVWAALALPGRAEDGRRGPARDGAPGQGASRTSPIGAGSVSSDPDEHVEQIATYVDYGFDHLVFHFPGNDQESGHRALRRAHPAAAAGALRLTPRDRQTRSSHRRDLRRWAGSRRRVASGDERSSRPGPRPDRPRRRGPPDRGARRPPARGRPGRAAPVQHAAPAAAATQRGHAGTLGRPERRAQRRALRGGRADARAVGRPDRRTTRTDAFRDDQVWVPAGTFTMGTDAKSRSPPLRAESPPDWVAASSRASSPPTRSPSRRATGSTRPRSRTRTSRPSSTPAATRTRPSGRPRAGPG